MVDFQLERLLPAITVFACITCVPAAEQNHFSIYKWFRNIFATHDRDNIKSRLLADDNSTKRNPVFDKTFKIIWNVPSFQCHKYGLNFSEVSEAGITQNYGDSFRGDSIALLYDPGLFPALLEANADSDSVSRNGGVPQEGNLSSHLDIFADQIQNKLIPDEHFSGIAIIDFEHWRPMWSENFGSLTSYRKLSRSIEQNKHPYWPATEIEKEFTTVKSNQYGIVKIGKSDLHYDNTPYTYSSGKLRINFKASKRFEKAAWQFFRRTLKTARLLRPNALWGYYGFPLCFNYTPRNRQARCSNSVMENNEKIKWLFEESTAIYPSLYYKKYSMTENTRALFMRGRISEAMRVSSMSKELTPVYPYTCLKYYDTKEFVDESDLVNSFVIPKEEGAAGVIIWGASNDVNTEAKCRSLVAYVKNVVAPIAKQVLQTPKKEIHTIFGNNIPQIPAPSFGNINFVDFVVPH